MVERFDKAVFSEQICFIRAAIHQADRHPGDLGLHLAHHSEIWQTPRQLGCWDACQISERYYHYNIQSCGFETLRDLTVRCVKAQWIEAQSFITGTLTHWGWDKMAAILQTHSNAFSWMKLLEFQLKFHWSLFLRVQSAIFHHWFR